MPQLPFSLLDFKRIEKFAPLCKQVDAAAGDPISAEIYRVPKHKLVWLIGIDVMCTKITSTALVCDLTRSKDEMEISGLPKATPVRQILIAETVGTTEGYVSWPAAKTPSLWVASWFPLFLHAGDLVNLTHAFTVAETIKDIITVNRIEYSDPRYEK